MGVVVFNVTEFRTKYPQFSTITDAQLLNFADIAYLIVDNTESSRIPETRRAVLINLLVCHMATLFMDDNTPFGGQLSSAKEGAVSASYYKYITTRTSQWYSQTPCGRMFWELMAPYRTGGKYFAYKRICPLQY